MMSTLDVIADILRDVAPRALCARELADLASGRLTTTSRTPQTVVSRDLALDVKRNGTVSKFLRAAPGKFLLKEALSTAFYSDVDGYASAWVRNLITAGELPPGVVDERSIQDLKPSDVASYRQFHAFSGIGVWARALRDAGVPNSFNVWSGSCPCQPWSSAGRRKGHSDDRDLWPEWFRLIAACRPALVIGEQVSSKDGLTWLDVVFNDLEKADYACQAFDLPACSVGAPHKRQRLYFVAYARERGREILGQAWLHDRGQPGHDALGRGAPDVGDADDVPDTAVARPRLPEDAGADRGDAIARAEADGRWTAGDLEPQRGRDDDATGDVPDTASGRWDEGSPIVGGGSRVDRASPDGDRLAADGVADGAGTVSDAERVVWDEGRGPRSPGWPEVELDRHGEADGAGCGCVRLGDAGLARGGRDTGALHRAQGVGEGERIEARDLADEPVAPGAADRRAEALVRGAAGPAGGDGGFSPGDRIRIDGDPTWGGAVRGYWAEDVEWIYCRPEPGYEDGRWRPTRSGIEPLVAGIAADVGRTRAARLRGYGNSIVLPLAVSFVGAVIDALADAARGVVVEENVAVEESADATKEVA